MALRLKRREMFSSILGCCYTTFDANVLEETATLLPGYIIRPHD